jgi:AcrR family transcriptional regulator
MKREQRRAQVLRDAAEVFAERGYHQTTISDIIAKAGIARGTFYLYFQDKRSIFDELIEGLLVSINERIGRIDPTSPPDVCLLLIRQNLRAILVITMEHRDLTKILLSDAVGLDPEFDRKLSDFYSNITDMLERSLRRGQAMGVVRPGDVRVNAVLIMGAFKELMFQVTQRRLAFDLEALVEALLQHYRDGVLVLPPSAKA